MSAPVVEGTVLVDGTSLTLLGVDLFAEQDIRSFTRQAQAAESAGSGSASLFTGFLITPGAAMTSAGTAEQLGLSGGRYF